MRLSCFLLLSFVVLWFLNTPQLFANGGFSLILTEVSSPDRHTPVRVWRFQSEDKNCHPLGILPSTRFQSGAVHVSGLIAGDFLFSSSSDGLGMDYLRMNSGFIYESSAHWGGGVLEFPVLGLESSTRDIAALTPSGLKIIRKNFAYPFVNLYVDELDILDIDLRAQINGRTFNQNGFAYNGRRALMLDDAGTHLIAWSISEGIRQMSMNPVVDARAIAMIDGNSFEEVTLLWGNVDGLFACPLGGYPESIRRIAPASCVDLIAHGSRAWALHPHYQNDTSQLLTIVDLTSPWDTYYTQSIPVRSQPYSQISKIPSGDNLEKNFLIPYVEGARTHFLRAEGSDIHLVFPLMTDHIAMGVDTGLNFMLIHDGVPIASWNLDHGQPIQHSLHHLSPDMAGEYRVLVESDLERKLSMPLTLDVVPEVPILIEELNLKEDGENIELVYSVSDLINSVEIQVSFDLKSWTTIKSTDVDTIDLNQTGTFQIPEFQSPTQTGFFIRIKEAVGE